MPTNSVLEKEQQKNLETLNIIFSAAHAGFDLSRVPLGGGAAVADALIRAWSHYPQISLKVLGGRNFYESPQTQLFPRKPASSNPYSTDPSQASAFEYAHFCRQFEKHTTAHILQNFSPQSIILSNDISEGPHFQQLSEKGYRIVTIYHVDVVDYFNQFYLKNLISPDHWTRLYDSLLKWNAHKLLPEILRLVFDKQRQSVLYSSKLICPSSQMVEVLENCYPGQAAHKTEVIPWGGWSENILASDISIEAQKLRQEFSLREDGIILTTLSRLSPEKGQDLLLQTLQRMERKKGSHSFNLFICGEAAFMRGAPYKKHLQKLGTKLKKTRVHFLGHISGVRKAAVLSLTDLFIHPSHHESYGLTIVEALRAGLPVLTTKHRSAQDLVQPGWGRVVDHSSEALAESITQLTSDKKVLKEMGENARRSSQNMSFTKAAERLFHICQELKNSPLS